MTALNGRPESRWAEIEALLDEEVSKLPAELKAPIVLCCLNQRTQSEAALQLGVSAGALWGRLTSACEALRVRLAQRGHEISAEGLMLLLSERAGSTTVSDQTVQAIVRLAKKLQRPR